MSERETIRNFFVEHNPTTNWQERREMVRLLSGRVKWFQTQNLLNTTPEWAKFGLMLFDLPRGNRLATSATWRDLYAATANYYNIVIGSGHFRAPHGNAWQYTDFMNKVWNEHSTTLRLLSFYLEGEPTSLSLNKASVDEMADRIHKITDLPLDPLKSLMKRVFEGAITKETPGGS